MNAVCFSADHHRQDGLRMRVYFVISVLVDDTQIHTGRLLRPMTVLTRLTRRNETIAFECRGNWSRESVRYTLDELPDPRRFGTDPAGSSGHHVTLDTLYFGMRRVLIGRKFRLHGMASRSAELWSLHVLDRPISDLSSDKEVKQSSDGEKPSYTPQCCFAIEFRFDHTVTQVASTEVNPNRD